MKKDKYDFSDLLQDESCDDITEKDFYPPLDNRYLESYISDINGGDNFADYCEYIFEILDEEDYWN